MHDTKLDILTQWLRRDWALVPLHDVSSGACSCRAGAGCGSGGKHPRYDKWQEDGQLVRSEPVLGALHAAHPEWNWGVATGATSGMWILDWDVDHDAGIRAWLREACPSAVDWITERVPDLGTLTLGPTGGGGWHYIFELPPDFEPRGSQTRNRHGLPPGLDVRGHHGQIVVAPSVSGKGPYGAVLIGAPIRRAPSWLEDMLRPQVVDGAVDRGRTTPDDAGQDLTGPDPRALAYARSAVGGALQELHDAPEGTRNDTAYRVACRLHELAAAPWSGYDEDVLLTAWWDSRWWHAVGRDTADGVWRRARARVAGAAAILPPGHGGSDVVPILDFHMPPEGGMSSGGPDPVQALIDQMLTPERIRELPKPAPLIQGLLDLRTCAWLIGRPKSGKSFVALDFAAHVGLGRAWQGRRVHQGLVIYIVAEGSQGIGLRLDAWEREFGPMKDLLVLPRPVPVNERSGKYGPDVAGGWTVLVEACRRLGPALVIIDTQARVTAGLKENDNDDMSYYAAQADRLKEACGACVLTVHHIGRSGTDARGASAIDGAQDAELRVERVSDAAMALTIHVDAQKDMQACAALTVGLKRSEGGASEDGRDLSSLVLLPMGELEPQDPAVPPEPLWHRHMRLLYKVIFDQFNGGSARGGTGGTFAEIRSAFIALPEMQVLAPKVATRAKYFRKSWNGADGHPGLVARGLVARPVVGGKVFKIVVIEDQSSDGVLTPNDPNRWTEATDGWIVYTSGDGPPE